MCLYLLLEVRLLPRITLRNSGRSFTAREAGDLSTSQAIAKAEELRAQKKYFTDAYVDRTDGLVLIGREGNWHFASANCGYDGWGTKTSAEILEMFGFGEKEALLQKIAVGGDHANYAFTHNK